MRTLLTLLAILILPVAAAAQQREPNHLLGEPSPYLAQHVYNVVDWYPWGEEALEKAKRENKPIFISVGYSTCHWCHVMADESFDNEYIGSFLNEHFVSIKIDRESRPDLDEQFMLVTQMLTGGGGWPNSVFLTSEAEPFHAGTYFPPDAFFSLLGQVDTVWKKQHDRVLEDAKNISTAVRNYLNRTSAARALDPDAILTAARSLLPRLDEFNGGFGVAPKFPQESALLFLLDQAERHGDAELLEAVTNALDGIIKGGIHDHVGGGFHRYAVDEAWLVPHFEKMLYNQALIGRLLVRAYALTGKPRYKRAASRTLDYVLDRMQAPEGGFFSAEDADSVDANGVKREGSYYIWDSDAFDGLLEGEAEFMAETFGVTKNGNFEHSNILHWKQLPVNADLITRIDRNLETLKQERRKRKRPHVDRKIVLAWNAAMIETLAEAAHLFKRNDYRDAAFGAADYILENMLGEKELRRISFEGKVGTQAQLQDYAGLGLALVALNDLNSGQCKKHQYLVAAETLAEMITPRFAESIEGGATVYRMTSASDGLGPVLPYDDTEIPSGNGLVLAFFDKLAKRTGNPGYSAKAELLAAALSGGALDSPQSRGYALKAASTRDQGEQGGIRVLANGAVTIKSDFDRNSGDLKLQISVKDGWHINANKPLEDYFVATELSLNGNNVSQSIYPEAEVKTLKFNDKPLALYEGDISLSAAFPTDGEKGSPDAARLTLQACSNEICLPPEETMFRFWR